MIAVREAVELANNFGKEVFQRSGSVEEVAKDGKFWLITLGYEEPENLFNPVGVDTGTGLWGGILGAQQKKIKRYKTFKIDGETKELISAKIFNP